VQHDDGHHTAGVEQVTAPKFAMVVAYGQSFLHASVVTDADNVWCWGRVVVGYTLVGQVCLKLFPKRSTFVRPLSSQQSPATIRNPIVGKLSIRDCLLDMATHKAKVLLTEIETTSSTLILSFMIDHNPLVILNNFEIQPISLGSHFRMLFQSSKHKTRTSLFIETWQESRSNFEL